jgi:hypothetical protein
VGGTATGAGTYTIGDTVEVVATPNPPQGDYLYSFNGWYDNTTQQLLSTDSTYSFEIFEDTDLIASFNVQQEI